MYTFGIPVRQNSPWTKLRYHYLQKLSSVPLIEINYSFLISTEIGAYSTGTVVIIFLKLNSVERDGI